MDSDRTVGVGAEAQGTGNSCSASWRQNEFLRSHFFIEQAALLLLLASRSHDYEVL